MLIILVFLILAVLLFGSSAVLGILGTIAGFIALAIALFLAIAAFNVYPTAAISIVIVIAAGIAGLFLADHLSGRKIAKEREERDALIRGTPIRHEFEMTEHKKMRDKMEPYLLECLAADPDSADIKAKLDDLRKRYPLPDEAEWRRQFG